MNTRAVVESYFERLKGGKGWEDLLAEDLVFTSYTSPVKRVPGKAAYLTATGRFYSSIRSVELRGLLVDGSSACALTRYQLASPTGSVFECPVAEILGVRDGKIATFDIYFDSAPFPK